MKFPWEGLELMPTGGGPAIALNQDWPSSRSDSWCPGPSGTLAAVREGEPRPLSQQSEKENHCMLRDRC